MKLTTIRPNVHCLELPINTQNDILTFHGSDIHFDSSYCQRDLLKKHLDIIKAANGYAFFYGDIFDVMGTFMDPRSKAQDIRPEYLKKGKPYLDAIVEDAFNFFKPYAENIVLMGEGNHETNITRRHDTNILDKLTFLLRTVGGITQKGGYAGYMKLIFKMGTTSKPVKIAYHHGKGGNAERSKGILNSQMDAMIYSDADIIVSGHDHNKLHDPSNVSYYLDDNGKICMRRIDWLKLGNYKRNEAEPLMGGYEVEKGYLPKDVGGYFIKFSTRKEKGVQLIERMIYPAQ
jgi:hypothetical protein